MWPEHCLGQNAFERISTSLKERQMLSDCCSVQPGVSDEILVQDLVWTILKKVPLESKCLIVLRYGSVVML